MSEDTNRPPIAPVALSLATASFGVRRAGRGLGRAASVRGLRMAHPFSNRRRWASRGSDVRRRAVMAARGRLGVAREIGGPSG